jgi:hypothetical protein
MQRIVHDELKGERWHGRWYRGGNGEGEAGGDMRCRREQSAGSRSMKEARHSICPPVRASSPDSGGGVGGGTDMTVASAGMAIGPRWWIDDGEAREWGMLVYGTQSDCWSMAL